MGLWIVPYSHLMKLKGLNERITFCSTAVCHTEKKSPTQAPLGTFCSSRTFRTSAVQSEKQTKPETERKVKPLVHGMF